MRRLVLAVLLLPSALLAPPGLAASYEEGLAAVESGRTQEGLAIWTALAAEGDALASHGLGKLYETGGEGVAPDPAAAARWYGQAARAGVAAARNNLARLYAKGEGVPRDPALAAELWQQAARSGHAPAQYNLGLLYLRGETLEADEARGAALILEAARAGVPAAQFVMGDLRRFGIGVAQDPSIALAWYLEAAAGGHEIAQLEAARLQERGVLAGRLDGQGSEAAVENPAPGQAAPADPSPADSPPANPPKPADLLTVAAPAPPAEPAGRFGLWLGSAGDAAAAERLAAVLAQRHRAALGDADVTLRAVEVAGVGPLFRLLAGAWPDRAAATRACALLRAADPDAFCTPVGY